MIVNIPHMRSRICVLPDERNFCKARPFTVLGAIMNFLKSVYVMSFITGAMVASIYAAMQMGKTGNYLLWAGPLLANAPFVLRLGWIMMRKNVARTSARFPLFIALGFGGVGLSTWMFMSGQGAMLPLLISVGGLLGFLLYSFWYSSFGGRHSAMLEPGKTLPDFNLKNVKGETVTSKDLRGRPHILMFYRGNWCPLCMAQIKEIAKAYQQINAHGAQVALISPQPHNFTKDLARRHDVDFDFYTDVKNNAARALGIAQKWGVPAGMQALGYKSEAVLPTVIITDPDGVILWADETDNYRVRPEPETFLAVLRDHGFAPASA